MPSSTIISHSPLYTVFYFVFCFKYMYSLSILPVSHLDYSKGLTTPHNVAEYLACIKCSMKIFNESNPKIQNSSLEKYLQRTKIFYHFRFLFASTSIIFTQAQEFFTHFLTLYNKTVGVIIPRKQIFF